MSHLTAHLRVRVPPETVFDLVADPARAPEWQSLVASVRDPTGVSGTVGSAFTGVIEVAGRAIQARFLVTAASRPHRFEVTATTAGGWARTTVAIAPDGSGSAVEVRLDYELAGETLGGLLGMLTGNAIEREFLTTVRRLATVAEATVAGGPPPVAGTPPAG